MRDKSQVTDIESELRDFVAFMETHSGEDLLFRGEGGVIVTRGCDGTFGTCCSKLHDMSGLVDALQELVGERKDGP